MNEDRSLLARHSIGDYMSLDVWLKRWDKAMAEEILNSSTLVFLLSIGWRCHPSSTPKGCAMDRRRLLIYLSILAGGSVMPAYHCVGNGYWTNRRLIEEAARKAVCKNVFGRVSQHIEMLSKRREPDAILSLVHYGLGTTWEKFLDREILDLIFEIFNPRGILFPSWKGRHKWEDETTEEKNARLFFRWILLNIWWDRTGKNRELLTWARRKTHRWVITFCPTVLQYANKRDPWIQKLLRNYLSRARTSRVRPKLKRRK